MKNSCFPCRGSSVSVMTKLGISLLQRLRMQLPQISLQQQS